MNVLSDGYSNPSTFFKSLFFQSLHNYGQRTMAGDSTRFGAPRTTPPRFTRPKFTPPKFNGALAKVMLVIGLICLIATSSLAHGSQSAFACTDDIDHVLVEDAWEMSSSGGYSLVSDFLTRSGDRALYLAGANNAEDMVRTQVVLSDAAPSTLHFALQIHTQEDLDDPNSVDINRMADNESADSLVVIVSTDDGRRAEMNYPANAADSFHIWQDVDMDLSAFQGERVTVEFAATTDGELVTDFFVDDINITLCATSGSSALRVFVPFMSK